MSNHLYKYNGTIGPLTDEQLLAAFLGLDRSSRSGSFTYSQDELFPSQIEEMKSWPEDVKEHVKAAAKAIKEASPSVSKQGMIRAAVAETISKLVVPRRATGKDKVGVDFEAKAAAGDLALSMLFKRAPDVGAALLPRQYTDKPQRFMAKVSSRICRLCVNVEDVDKADVYVSALYNEQLGRAFLLGYATKEDMKKAKKGNRMTDPENCQWQKMSYYLNPDEIKPLGMIIKHFGLSGLPEGVAFERVMLPEVLPLPSKVNVDLFSQGVVDAVDFDALLGLAPKKDAAPAAKPAPMPEELPIKLDNPKPAPALVPDKKQDEFAF